MIQRKKRSVSILVIFLISLIILLTISAFIKVPFRIKTYSEVFPKEKWLLTRGKSGEIISNVIDYTKGHTTLYNISNFERGEVVSVDFFNYLKDKKEFIKGDTIVFIKSSDVLSQLKVAEGELQVAIANLKAQASPQKTPVIQEAEERLRYVREKIQEQKLIFDRTEQLYKKGLTSEQEYQLQQGTCNLLNIEEKIYISQIANLKTGVKPEAVELLQSEIKAIESKLSIVKMQQKQHLIISPIDGKIISSFSPDTLLYVSNFHEVVLHVPIKIIDLKEFHPGQDLIIQNDLLEETFPGKVLSIEKEVHIINGQQVVYLSLVANNDKINLLPGMILENELILRKTSFLNQLINLVTR